MRAVVGGNLRALRHRAEVDDWQPERQEVVYDKTRLRWRSVCTYNRYSRQLTALSPNVGTHDMFMSTGVVQQVHTVRRPHSGGPVCICSALFLGLYDMTPSLPTNLQPQLPLAAVAPAD